MHKFFFTVFIFIIAFSSSYFLVMQIFQSSNRTENNIVEKSEIEFEIKLPDDRKSTAQKIIDQNGEEIIWQGESGDFKVRWTNRDIYVEKNKKTEKLFTTFAKNYYNLNFKYESIYSERLGKYVKTKRLNTCDISINGEIASFVGKYLTLEIEEYFFCGIPQYYSHWVVFDLENTKRIKFSSIKKDSYAIGQGLKLTDLFEDREILQAFLSNDEVKKTISIVEKNFQPKNTFELLKWFQYQDELYWKNAGGKKTFEFEDIAFENLDYSSLNTKALTAFAFNRIEDGKIIIQISLEPQYKRHGIIPLELKLNIPDKLREQFELSNSNKSGFLGKDLGVISRSSFSSIEFESVKIKSKN